MIFVILKIPDGPFNIKLVIVIIKLPLWFVDINVKSVFVNVVLVKLTPDKLIFKIV